MRWMLLMLSLGVAGLAMGQVPTAGQMAYDVYNGSRFVERLVSPLEGKALVWEDGVLVSKDMSYTLPAPGVTTLGGVMRNVRPTGGFVTGINGSGQLVFEVPPVGLAPDGNGSMLTGITAAQVGALAPNGNGSMLTGITAAQVGALAPNGNGSALTGITAAQVGALAPNGNGSALTGITAAQVGALAPDGDGSMLTGITAAQVGALAPDGDGSMLTGITAAQVGAIAGGDANVTLTFGNSGLRILDLGFDNLLLLNADEDFSEDRTLKFRVNDADRVIDLAGDLTVADAATVSGNNTGNVNLAGTPNYITISGQTITRSLINLGLHVTGTAGVGNGGTGLTTSGTAGLVMTSTGTGFAMQTPLNAALARYQVQPQQLDVYYDSFTSQNVAGSGSTAANGRQLSINTGATAASRAQRNYDGPTNDVWLGSPGAAQTEIDWSRRVTVGFALTLITSSGSNSNVYVRIGQGYTTSGPLSGRGVGIRIANLTLTAACHNGTTLNTSGSLKTLTVGSVTTQVILQSDGAGNVAVFIDGVLATTLTGGPTSANGINSVSVEALNGADAASTRFHLSQVRIRVD